MSTEQDFQIEDDFAVDPTTYPDRDVSPRPPLPGAYSLKVSKWDFRRDKDGKVVMWKDKQGNPKYPVISLTTGEITDPIDYTRKVVFFQDIPTYPFEREGKTASAAADVLRSLNAEATASNTGEIIRQVTEGFTAGMEFKIRLDYTAYDSVYAKTLLAQLPQNADAKAKRQAYDKAKVQGYRNIQKANIAAGQPHLPIHKWVGPSGTVIDVRPMITVFYPADAEVPNLGPDAKLVTPPPAVVTPA